MLSVRPATAYDGDGAVYWVRRHHLSPWALPDMTLSTRLVCTNYAHRLCSNRLTHTACHAEGKKDEVEY